LGAKRKGGLGAAKKLGGATKVAANFDDFDSWDAETETAVAVPTPAASNGSSNSSTASSRASPVDSSKSSDSYVADPTVCSIVE
jgi:hypothetical protein